MELRDLLKPHINVLSDIKQPLSVPVPKTTSCQSVGCPNSHPLLQRTVVTILSVSPSETQHLQLG